jgi:hypothetical protein
LFRKYLSFLFIICLAENILAVNDTLVVSNGNVLVGELKTMDKSVIQMETDYSDNDFKIDWDEVTEIYSKRLFVITTAKGDRYYGTIRSDRTKKGQVIITEEATKHTLNITDIVFLNQVDKNFLSRLSASISIGFSHAKSNNLTQFSTIGNLGYLTDHWTLDMAFNGVRSTQDDVDPTKRIEGGISFRYLLPADWFTLTSYNFLQNDEQKLKLRSLVKVGAGYFIIRNNSMYFASTAGADWNNENYTDPTIPSRNSAEGFAGFEINLYDMGDLSLLSSLVVYPSFTDKGRIRSDFLIDLKYDFPLDLYVKLGYTFNYDNKPAEGASETDYLFQTTVGWDL